MLVMHSKKVEKKLKRKLERISWLKKKEREQVSCRMLKDGKQLEHECKFKKNSFENDIWRKNES